MFVHVPWNESVNNSISLLKMITVEPRCLGQAWNPRKVSRLQGLKSFKEEKGDSEVSKLPRCPCCWNVLIPGFHYSCHICSIPILAPVSPFYCLKCEPNQLLWYTLCSFLVHFCVSSAFLSVFGWLWNIYFVFHWKKKSWHKKSYCSIVFVHRVLGIPLVLMFIEILAVGALASLTWIKCVYVCERKRERGGERTDRGRRERTERARERKERKKKEWERE